MQPARLRSWSPFAFAVVLGAGCFVSDPGQSPPPNALYYPTGLVVSPSKKALYVANSDFDLQFNGGTVLALDLPALRSKQQDLLCALKAIGDGNHPVCVCPAQPETRDEICKAPLDTDAELTTACKTFSGSNNDNVILYPGPCKPLDISKKGEFIRASATLGAFASDVALAQQPGGPGARLFVPVRGDPSITFLDITDDPSVLDCGGSRCSAIHKIGIDPFDNTRQLSLPVEPVGIAASEDGSALVITHQTQKTVSLVVNRLPDPNNSSSRPTLEFLLPVAEGPTEVATVPIPRVVSATKASYTPGFLVTYRGAAQVDLLRFQSDLGAAPPRPFLTRVAQVPINTNSDGKDSRGIAIDATERRACEAPCGQADVVCLGLCADIPLRLFVANRAPASLLVGNIKTTLVKDEKGNITGAFDVPAIEDTVALAFGASKVTVGQVIGPDGKPQTRVFAAAFDTRLVFSYDPVAHRVDAVMRVGRGPHALVVDTDFTTDPAKPHAFLFVAHFTDSYMGVVDLDMRNPDTFGTMFAGIGTPTPPKESK